MCAAEKEKRGRELCVGDQVQDSDDNWVRLTSVGNGMRVNSRLIEWGKGEWACIGSNDIFQVRCEEVDAELLSSPGLK